MKSLKNATTFRCMTVILSAVLVVATMSGCALQSLLPSFGTQNDPSQTVIPDVPDMNSPPEGGGEEAPPALPTYYDPLTGLGSDVDLSALRPVAFCVGADEGGGFGLSAAKILIEAPTENGTSRLVGITNTYASLPAIGDIQTTRPYLLTLTSLFSAVSVHAGVGEGGALTAENAIDYKNPAMGTVFYRNPEFTDPTALFTSGTRLVGAMESFEKRGASLPYLLGAYGEMRAIGSIGAKSVILPFSGSTVTQFTYDSASGEYLRRQNSSPHIDGASGEQLSFTNLIFLICESSIYNKVSGTELDLDLQNGGEGYYVSGGKAARITWSRKADGSLLLCDEKGAEILCNRGKTYISLVDITDAPALMIVN